MELVDRFFEVGAHVVGTDHAVAILLAGCRECLPEWEIQHTRRLLDVTEGEANARTITEWFRRATGVCPRGQNGHPQDPPL